MSYFEPKMLVGEKLKVQINLAYSAEQKLLFTSLADAIFKDSVNLLMLSTKIGAADSVEVDLTVEHLKQRYMFDTKLFNEVGVKREIEKLAAAEEIKVYPYGPGKILITF